MRRLAEDPESSAALRGDLVRSRAAGEDYPTSAKLLALRAALADPTRQPLGEPSALRRLSSLMKRASSHAGWKLLALIAVGGGLALVAQPQPARQPAPNVAPAPAPLQPLAAEVPEPPAPVAAPEVAAPREEPPAAAGAPARPRPDTASRREIAQLVRIRALLPQDPAAALRLAQQGQREFPHGVLSEEREALAIVALARLDADEAARRAREFVRRHPESPLRDLVQAANHR